MRIVQSSLDTFRGVILAGLGRAPELIEPGRFHRFPTSDRRGDTAGWCKLFDDQRGGVFGCYRQGISQTWRADNESEMTRAQRAALARDVMAAGREREQHQRWHWAENARRFGRVWSQCLPLQINDPVSLYLKRRGMADLWPLPDVLRWHPALPYWHEAENLGTFPAMVAPIIAPDGRMVALHRTYLTADGRKADVPSPKKLTSAAGPLAGACIPLHRPAQGCIGVAEGIETALAAAQASGIPTLATYCAGNLAAWHWPAGVRRIVVFADADQAGREAAEALRARVRAASLRCDVMVPATEGADWCDVWAQRETIHDQDGGAA